MKTKLATITLLVTFDIANYEQLGYVNELKVNAYRTCQQQITMKQSDYTRLVKAGPAHSVKSWCGQSCRRVSKYFQLGGLGARCKRGLGRSPRS